MPSKRTITLNGQFAFPLDRAALSEPARDVMRGHVQRLDTRSIEDPAERPKMTRAKQGASTHVLLATARTDRRPLSTNFG